MRQMNRQLAQQLKVGDRLYLLYDRADGYWQERLLPRQGSDGVTKGGVAIVLAEAGSFEIDAPRAAAQDLRVLPLVIDGRGKQARDFRASVPKLSQNTSVDWGIDGPRTARWLVEAISEQGHTPTTRHFWCRALLRLSDSDAGVEEHSVAELLEVAIVQGRLNISKCAYFETVARRAAAEGGAASTDFLDEHRLLLGQGRGRGHALVAPTLEKWVSSRLQEESAVLKERRKAREER